MMRFEVTKKHAVKLNVTNVKVKTKQKLSTGT